MRTLIDGYPLPDDDPDLEIHLRIDEYLAGPANERSFGSTAARVLGTAPVSERYRWLMPLLRRAEWLLEDTAPGRAHWPLHLMSAVHILLNHNKEQTEEELLALLGYSGVFRATKEAAGFGEIVPRAVAAFKKSSDKGLWVEALENACFELEQFPDVYGGRHAAELGMALMIDPAAPMAISPCWSTRVANDLPTMQAKEAAAWRGLFALADTRLIYPQEPPEKKVAAALKKIPAVQFAARLDAWTALLKGADAVYLSWRGMAVLKILLQGAAAVGVPELQGPLRRLAQVGWRQPDRARLALDLLVRAIAAQPAAFSRDCLGLVAKQSYATDCAALNVALSAPHAEMQTHESTLGIDGYPLTENPQTVVLQYRLDEWLRLPGTLLDGFTGGPDLRTLAMREEEPDYPGLLSALLDRLDWINRHRALVPQHDQMTRVLTRYLPELQKLVNHIERETLLRLIGADAKGALYCSPGEQILETVERYIEREGFDLELVSAVEVWHKAAHGSIAEQTLRRHLGWLLWREDVKPVKLKSCWSARVRQDLRDMPGAKKKRWRELLAAMTFHICNEPPAKWKKQTAPLLAAVGAEEFASRLHEWFRAFGEDQPLPLEATGSDVLRCLIWHAAEVDDARVDEALEWFAQAQWKSKKSQGYTTKLRGPYVYALSRKSPQVAHSGLDRLVQRGEIGEGTKPFEVYRQVCEKLGVACREGAPAPRPLTPQDVVTVFLQKAGCEVTEEVVVVRAETETYLVERKSREIRRLRDGAVLTLDLGAHSGPGAELLASVFKIPGPEGAGDLQGILPLVRMLKMDQQFLPYFKVRPAETRLQ